MLDVQNLQDLKDNQILSTEEFDHQKHRLAAKILQKDKKIHAQSGIIYIILAFCLGAVGIHNFYARYWKRGLIQFGLAVISPFMMFVPLMFTSIWAMLELLFVNHGANGCLFSGNRKIILLLRAGAVVTLAWFAASTDMVVHEINIPGGEDF